MEMIVVPIEGAHFAKPLAIRSGRFAQSLLDRGMNKDALDLRIGRGAFYEGAAAMYIVFVDVPRTSTGKIQKFKLRQIAKEMAKDA